MPLAPVDRVVLVGYAFALGGAAACGSGVAVLLHPVGWAEFVR